MRALGFKTWLSTVGGTLAVAATFALSVPGIQVARASEPSSDAHEFSRFLSQTGDALAQPAESPSCGAANANRASANSADLLGNVMRQMEAEAAREGHKGPVEVIVLNNRGYNYGAATAPQIEQHWIEQELGR